MMTSTQQMHHHRNKTAGHAPTSTATALACQQHHLCSALSCRERLQRAYDGFHSTDAAGVTHAVEYTDLEGPNTPVPGGYQHLAELLAAEAEVQGAKFHLNHTVKKIEWRRPDGKVAIQLAAETAGGDASRTSNRQTPAAAAAAAAADRQEGCLELFDAVVFTGSLGVLKAQAGQLFDPQLPAAKAAAIQQLHIGQVEKLFVEWPAAAAEVHGLAAGSDLIKQQQQQQSQAEHRSRGSGDSASAPKNSRPAAAAAAAAAAASTPAVVGPRKPKTQLHDFSIESPEVGAAAETADDLQAATAAAGGKQEGNEASSSSSFTTYCLLWPSREELWGRQWLAQQQQQGSQTQTLATDVPAYDPVYVDCLSSRSSSRHAASAAEQQQQQQQQPVVLPSWLLGLHSWRYGDGPEWIKPPHSSSSSAAWQQQQQGSPERCAVVWVTGRAAGQLQQLADEVVLQHLERLLAVFPAIPRPEGREGIQAGPDRGPDGSGNAQAGPENGPDGQAYAQAGLDRGPDGSASPDDAQAGPERSPDAAQASHSSLAGCKLLRSTWSTDQRFLGSYSYPGPAASGATADVLAQPLTAADADAGTQQQQGALVCFAGEATSRHHMGTVHGAYMSGVREAGRLLAQWGLSEP
jgi:hypothetical protein